MNDNNANNNLGQNISPVPIQNNLPNQASVPQQGMIPNQVSAVPIQNEVPNQANAMPQHNVVTNQVGVPQQGMIPNQVNATPQQGLTFQFTDVNQQKNNNVDEDEVLLEAFVGENYNSFKTDSFNIGAFFLNTIYLFYRKMVLYALGISFIYFVLQFTPIPLFVLTLALVIFLGLFSNKLYLSFARKKVQSIKKKNPGSSLEQLKAICAKKGGTSIGFGFLGAFLEIIMMMIILFIAMFAILAAFLASFGINLSDIKFDDTEEYEPYEELLLLNVSGDTRNAFNLVAPTGFKETGNNVDYEYEYTYYEANNSPSCSFSFAASSNNSEFSSNEIVNSYAEFNDLKGISHSDVQTNTVNGIKWDSIKISDGKDTIYYVTKYNGNIYYLRYLIPSGSTSQCTNLVDSTIKGITTK